MILLKKKQTDNTYYEFDKILENGYHIKEDKDRTIQKFANGHRKEIVSSYTDVQITIDLGTFDAPTTKAYLSQLESGTYQYYSLKENTMKETQFIIKEIPEIEVERFADTNGVIGDFSITLYKAGD